MSKSSTCPPSRPRRNTRRPGDNGINGNFEYYYYSPALGAQAVNEEDTEQHGDEATTQENKSTRKRKSEVAQKLLTVKKSKSESCEVDSTEALEETENICEEASDTIPNVESGDVVLAVPVPETKVLVLRLNSQIKSGGQDQDQKIDNINSEGQDKVDQIKEDFEFIDEVDFEEERKSFVKEVEKDHSYNTKTEDAKEGDNCTCKLCGFKSTNKFNLKHHMKRCDPVQRLKNVFPCTMCGLELSSMGNLRKHWKRCEGIRKRALEAKTSKVADGPQMCDKCGKVFAQNNFLNQHSRRCDPIGNICKEEHEHKLLDKTFDSVDDAMAFVFDNELDAEFSRRTNEARRSYIAFGCARNMHGTRVPRPRTTTKNMKSKKLAVKCPAKFKINGNAESHKRNTTKTRMFGCLVHNHADNPTMKRITWLQKRRIAKHLLLGHTRMDIWKNIMPKLHIEGQKRVYSQDVSRVHEAIQKDKHHKLREGHDIASLLGKDGSNHVEEARPRAYPWPTSTNCPLKNAEHEKKYRMGSRGIPSTSSNQETIDAVSSIAPNEDNAATEVDQTNSPNVQNDQNTLSNDQDEPICSLCKIDCSNVEGLEEHIKTEHRGAFRCQHCPYLTIYKIVLSKHLKRKHGDGSTPINPIPSEASSLEESATVSEDTPTLSGEAIDTDAFEALRQKALRCLGTDGALAQKLLPVISGLAADSQGVAEIQSIVGSTFFELMVKYDNVNDPQPKPPPNPEFVRKYERAKERWRARGWKPSYKKPTKIRPDEEFM